MSNVIRTHNPSLPTTLRAIAVCWWALLADCLAGQRAITGNLWSDYRLARAEQRAFDAATHTPHDKATETAKLLAELDERDESALDTFGREFGQPGWLSATVIALVVSGVAIDMADGWGTLFEAIGTALQMLGRS